MSEPSGQETDLVLQNRQLEARVAELEAKVARMERFYLRLPGNPTAAATALHFAIAGAERWYSEHSDYWEQVAWMRDQPLLEGMELRLRRVGQNVAKARGSRRQPVAPPVVAKEGQET